MRRRSHSTDPLDLEFLALRREVALKLEYWTSLIAIGGSLLALAALWFGVLSGSAVPVKASWVPITLMAWYGASALALRRGRYWLRLRFVSSALDVTMAAALLLLDLEARGPSFALTAGGPSLFFVAVAASMLRLDPRLSIFSGALAAAQMWGISTFLLVPAVSPEIAPHIGVEPFVTATRSVLLLVMGAFGVAVTSSLRALVFRSAATALERERVRGLFGVYMSEAVVEHILAGAVKEGGERRTVTVLFSDIRDFTTLSESRAPEEVVKLLNTYFDRMCAVVARHGGVVNKFLGDGMLVVFGAPEAVDDDAGRALAAALEMQAEAAKLASDGLFPNLRVGVGVHRGELVAGNVGGEQRQEYTVIGDTVNTAARVQDLTKALGEPVVVTSSVVAALPGHAFRAVGEHLVKGRSQPLTLFAPAPAPARDAA